MIFDTDSGHSNYAIYDLATGIVVQIGTYPNAMIVEQLERGEPILPITAKIGDTIDLTTGEIKPLPDGVTLGDRVFHGPVPPPPE